jgi:hypothetical protein
MRRAMSLSRLSSSFCAAGSNSIFHFGLEAIAAHHFFEWDGTNPAGTNLCETLLGEVDIFELLEVLKDGFASVVCFGAAGALGEASEAFFDVVGKADG